MTQNTANNDLQERHRFAVPFTLVAVGLCIIYAIGFSSRNATIALYERPSIASAFSWIGLVVGISITILCYRRLVAQDDTLSEIERLTERQSARNLISRFATGVLVGTIIFVITTILFYAFSYILDDFSVAPLSAAILISVYGGLLAYGIAFWVSMLGTGGLLRLVGIAVFFGLIWAVARVENPNWFKKSISYMSHDSGSALIFRMTFFLAGSIFLAVTRDLVNNFRYVRDQAELSTLNFRIIQFLLITIPVLLAGVGIFPTSVSNFSDFMHNVSSHVGALVMFILMVAVHRFTDLYPSRFLIFTKVMIAAVVACWAGWQIIKLYNFVTFELLLMAVMGFWILTFYRLTEQYIRAYQVPDSAT